MTTPSEPDPGDADDTQPDTVRVPIRLGDGISTHDETAKVQADAARHWDARLWSDKPPL
jgi:hypothetical protein